MAGEAGFRASHRAHRAKTAKHRTAACMASKALGDLGDAFAMNGCWHIDAKEIMFARGRSLDAPPLSCMPRNPAPLLSTSSQLDAVHNCIHWLSAYKKPVASLHIHAVCNPA